MTVLLWSCKRLYEQPRRSNSVSLTFDQVRTLLPSVSSFVILTVVADPISLANISMQLSDSDDLSAGLVLPNHRQTATVSLLNDYIGMLSSADSPTQAGRATSFMSLAGSKVQVEFEVVCRRLRRRVLEAVAREKHGDEGVRILRLLLDTGKMDEKQVNSSDLPYLFHLVESQLVWPLDI